MSNPATKRPKMDAENENASGSGTQRKSTSPKKTCKPFVQTFDAIIDTAAFVDKSLFIKAFLEAEEAGIVVLAPRRFGKSTNMNMVQHFVSGNVELFKGLKIYEEERKFFDDNCKATEPNPVLYVDFKRVGGTTYDAVLESVKEAIGKAYGHHEDLVTRNHKGKWIWTENTTKSRGITAKKFTHYLDNPEKLSENDVTCGLERLSKCLKLHYGKLVYVFIDEYDHPLMQAIMDNLSKNEVVAKTIALIRRVISNLFRDNEYVKKALLMACVRVADVLSGDANNIVHFDFLRKPSFAPYFGFTDREVKELFEREEFVNFRDDDEIRNWYNGYRLVGTDEYVIYSPFSILNYLRESRASKIHAFRNYWVNSGYIINLERLFANTGIRDHIENLIVGGEVEIATADKITENHIFLLKSFIHNVSEEVNADLFLQFLWQNGYLNAVQCIKEPVSKAILRVPNKEIKRALERACYDTWYFRLEYKLVGTKIAAYQNALCAILEDRNDIVFISFAKALSELFIGKEMRNEDEVHCILYAFAYNLKMLGARSELIIRKKGRLNILVIWRHRALIIELKFKSGSSEIAHQQIITKGYDTVLKEDQYKEVTKADCAIRKEEPKTVEAAFNISGIECIKTQIVVNKISVKVMANENVTDDITICGQTSGRSFKPIELNGDNERITNDSDDKKETFVNDLLAGEEESINKVVEEQCERLLENSPQARNILNIVSDQIEQIPNLLMDYYLDNPAQILDGVRIADDLLTTSSSCRRRPATKRKLGAGQAVTVGKTSYRNKKQKTGQNLETKSSSSCNPIEAEENKNETTQEKPSTGLRDCPICFESLSGKISATSCGHVFCTACIVAAIKTQKSCPTCRTKLTLRNIRPLFV